MSRRDKIIFSLGMVQADSNVIKSEDCVGSYPNEKIILSRRDKSQIHKKLL